MAFNARYIFPIDQNARAAVGVNLPFSGNSVFTPNFTTKDAIRYNLINFWKEIKLKYYLSQIPRSFFKKLNLRKITF